MIELPAAPIIDAVIALTLVECAALAAWRYRTGTGPTLDDVGLNLLSGLCLMLALRALARDAGSAWVAVCLLAAGAAHFTDLARRWRRSGEPQAAGKRSG
jgi:hypothetical protein